MHRNIERSLWTVDAERFGVFAQPVELLLAALIPPVLDVLAELGKVSIRASTGIFSPFGTSRIVTLEPFRAFFPDHLGIGERIRHGQDFPKSGRALPLAPAGRSRGCMMLTAVDQWQHDRGGDTEDSPVAFSVSAQESPRQQRRDAPPPAHVAPLRAIRGNSSGARRSSGKIGVCERNLLQARRRGCGVFEFAQDRCGAALRLSCGPPRRNLLGHRACTASLSQLV